MYETFDHTADLGLRVRAADLPELFADAGRALLAALVENPEAVRAEIRVEVELPADDLEYQLFDWLKTLLYHFEAEGMLCSRFVVRHDAAGVHGEAWGERYDPARHEPAHEVKAITYHDLSVQRVGDGWLAEVIVDI